MKVSAAMLCDFATVREGLLHVLGAGVNRVWQDNFPGRFNVCLALLIDARGDDNELHRLAIAVKRGRRTLTSVSAEFRPAPAAEGPVPAELVSHLPVVFDLRDAPVPAEGFYSVVVDIDGRRVAKVDVLAASRPAQNA